MFWRIIFDFLGKKMSIGKEFLKFCNI